MRLRWRSMPPIIAILRPNQWVKNLVLFTAIIFTGELFSVNYLYVTFLGFVIFCMLSSSSYIFNDIIDVRFDKQHPVKKLRPLAAGKLSLSTAIELAFILGLFGLIGALFLSISFFLVAASFLLLHIFYSLVLKKYAVFDILGIAFSFILRAFAGEILTFYHLPFWLFMTIMFIALFVATAKRHAELLRQGTSSRPTLFQYREKLLDFYTSMFGSASIIAYSLFTFLEGPPHFNAPFKEFLSSFLPQAIDRKWMILTIPFVVFGLMRYAQLAYEGSSAEQPEKIVTTDIPLIVTILLWGLTIVMILYIL